MPSCIRRRIDVGQCIDKVVNASLGPGPFKCGVRRLNKPQP